MDTLLTREREKEVKIVWWVGNKQTILLPERERE
jgi:hypothetical protein